VDQYSFKDSDLLKPFTSMNESPLQWSQSLSMGLMMKGLKGNSFPSPIIDYHRSLLHRLLLPIMVLTIYSFIRSIPLVIGLLLALITAGLLLHDVQAGGIAMIKVNCFMVVFILE